MYTHRYQPPTTQSHYLPSSTPPSTLPMLYHTLSPYHYTQPQPPYNYSPMQYIPYTPQYQYPTPSSTVAPPHHTPHVLPIQHQHTAPQQSAVSMQYLPYTTVQQNYPHQQQYNHIAAQQQPLQPYTTSHTSTQQTQPHKRTFVPTVLSWNQHKHSINSELINISHDITNIPEQLIDEDSETETETESIVDHQHHINNNHNHSNNINPTDSNHKDNNSLSSMNDLEVDHSHSRINYTTANKLIDTFHTNQPQSKRLSCIYDGCNKRFKLPQQLNTHIESTHINNNTPPSTNKKRKYNRQKSHHNESSTTRLLELSNMINDTDSDVNTSIARHPNDDILNHTIPGMVQCGTTGCDQLFQTPVQAKQHSQFCHPRKLSKYLQKSNLQRNRTTNSKVISTGAATTTKPYKIINCIVSDCQRTFINDSQLHMHLPYHLDLINYSKRTRTDTSKQPAHTGAYDWICSECNAVYSASSSLLRHHRHTGHTNIVAGVSIGITDDNKDSECSICSLGGEIFMCDVCPYAYHMDCILYQKNIVQSLDDVPDNVACEHLYDIYTKKQLHCTKRRYGRTLNVVDQKLFDQIGMDMISAHTKVVELPIVDEINRSNHHTQSSTIKRESIDGTLDTVSTSIMHCTQCDRTFADEKYLQLHMNVVHKHEYDDDDIAENVSIVLDAINDVINTNDHSNISNNDGTMTHQCPIDGCDRIFNRQSYLTQHLVRGHKVDQ